MHKFHPRFSILVGDGNSLTYGSGTSSPATENWMAQLLTLLTSSQSSRPKDYWGLVNKGTGSITTAQLTARFEATVHPLYNKYRKRNIVAFLEVINDIRQGNVSDDEALENVLAYHSKATSLGWDVLFFSVPPTGPADTLDDGLPGVTTGPALVNDYLRSNIGRLSRYPLVDIAVPGKLDTPTDETYWHPDEVHPNADGYSIMAQYVLDIINGL